MTVSADPRWRRSGADIPVTRPRVAFQGERGAYGDIAITQLWEGDALPLASWSFDDVITAVVRGKCDYGVLPVENTVVGRIRVVCDTLEAVAGLAVIGETTVAVRHALLAPPGITLDMLRIVTSHPVALAQCGRFLARYPGLAAHECYDTAGAARDVAARARRDEGAIAGVLAARRYHLEVLAEDIQDVADNTTRFVVIKRRGVTPRRDLLGDRW